MNKCKSCNGRSRVWFNGQTSKTLKTKPKLMGVSPIYTELLCVQCKGNGLVAGRNTNAKPVFTGVSFPLGRVRVSL